MEGDKVITVGIPAYNEERCVAATIESVLKQISKKDEVLVVDNGSVDNTAAEIKRMQKKDKRVKLLAIRENNGKTPALNLIIKRAKSEIIVQTDADVIVENGAIFKLLRHFKNPEVGAVSGQPIPIIPRHNLFHDWAIMSYRKAHELRLNQSKTGEFWHLSGYLCAFRKKAYTKLPKQKGAVDALMGLMIKQKGYLLEYEPEARVLVKCPRTIKDFVAQKARVRAGYYFLTRYGGKPRGAGSEIIHFPKELLRLPLQRWPAFIASAFVYAYTWVKGWVFFKRNRPLNEIWKQVTSSK